MLTLLGGMALLLLGIYWRVRPGWRRSGPYLPDACLLGLLIYACGISWLLVFEPSPHQEKVAAMAWSALASAGAGATLYCLASAPLYRGTFAGFVADTEAGPLERAVIGLGLAASAAACALFLYLVLRTDAIAALLGVGSVASDPDLLRARMLIASGSEAWLAPGYFKQFRDILLPVLLAAAIILDPRCLRRIWFWALTALALLAVLVSGQRLVVVVFLISLAMAAHYARIAVAIRRAQRRRIRVPWKAAAIVMLGYGALTFLLGRVRDESGEGGLMLRIAGNFLDRVFLAAPRENSLTYPVWSEAGPSTGMSWLNDLSGVLPGTGEGLSNVLHMATGGSALGNSPLGLAPDTWLAWGWAGLAVLPAVLAVVAGLIDLACRMRRSPVLVGLRLYLFLILPVCYSPFILLLYGGGVAVVLITLILVIRRPSRPLPAPAAG
jgi:hypothetical protein